jgi:rhodanese-related sulfurtransferase
MTGSVAVDRSPNSAERLGSTEGGVMPGPIPELDPLEASRRLEGGDAGERPLLVDVREPSEFAERRIPGAILLPLSGLAEDPQALPMDRPLIIHCASGKRSQAAGEFLSRHGYGDVSNLEGGILAWQKAGLPTVEGAPAPGEGELPSGSSELPADRPGR